MRERLPLCLGYNIPNPQGRLRSLPSQPHSHLRFVEITGFYGHKDQLELALHILRNSVVLGAMKIDPKPSVAAKHAELLSREGLYYLDGYEVARKFMRREDHHNVVRITSPWCCLKHSAK